MLAERLEVAYLEAGLLQHRHHHADLVQLAVGEHVALDQIAVDPGGQVGSEGGGQSAAQGLRPPQGAFSLRVAGTGDGVVEQASLRREEREQRGGVGLESLAPDVLEHADRADGVEGPVGHVAVVLDADLHQVVEAGLLDPLSGQLGLFDRQGDAHRRHAVVLSGVEHHRAPAAPDVEQAHARRQAQLATDEVELGLLGRLEGRRPVSPRHRRSRPSTVRAPAGRSRWRRRSGARSPGGRAGGCAALPSSRISSGGGGGGRSTEGPASASSERIALGSSLRSACAAASRSASRSPSRSTSPATKARTSPSSPGRLRNRVSASGRRTTIVVGAPGGPAELPS